MTNHFLKQVTEFESVEAWVPSRIACLVWHAWAWRALSICLSPHTCSKCCAYCSITATRSLEVLCFSTVFCTSNMNRRAHVALRSCGSATRGGLPSELEGMRWRKEWGDVEVHRTTNTSAGRGWWAWQPQEISEVLSQWNSWMDHSSWPSPLPLLPLHGLVLLGHLHKISLNCQCSDLNHRQQPLVDHRHQWPRYDIGVAQNQSDLGGIHPQCGA